jgi:hypothetical protein
LFRFIQEVVQSFDGDRNRRSTRAVRLEFQSRADRNGVKDRFAAAFAKVALPKSTAATKTIGSIKSLAGLGQERFNSLVSGRSDPVARMAAARMAAA